jgi:shikimate kinase
MADIHNSNSGLIVLVGLMGAGKTSVGRRLAQRFDRPFIDSDHEIVKERFGEQNFRDGERRVILRLLEGEPQIIATGGGAFMDPVIREKIKEMGVSVWLHADLDILVDRTSHRKHRPLLLTGNPRETLQKLMDERYPVYAQADVIVDTGPESSDYTANEVAEALEALDSKLAGTTL